MNKDVKLEIPFLGELVKRIDELTLIIKELQKKNSLQQEWYSLQEACKLKGINCNSINNSVGRKYQPKFGIPDTIMSGRKWYRTTIEKWLKLSGEEIEKLWKNR